MLRAPLLHLAPGFPGFDPQPQTSAWSPTFHPYPVPPAPPSPSGMLARMDSSYFLSMAAVMSEAMKPGAMALQVMPRDEYSRATVLVSPMTPACEGEQQRGRGRGRGRSDQRVACAWGSVYVCVGDGGEHARGLQHGHSTTWHSLSPIQASQSPPTLDAE